MANYDIQVALHSSTGLPENDCVNVLHYEINAPDTVEGTCDDIAAAYVLLNPILGDVVGATIKVYTPGANPGGPDFQKDYATVTGEQNGVREVACCLSYATVDDPDASTARRRGRIYVGPLDSSTMQSQRPDSGMRDFVLDFGEALASAGSASNTTWLMYSQTDAVYVKIESIYVDDAWDVQRRRGLAPTMRETRDVQ